MLTYILKRYVDCLSVCKALSDAVYQFRTSVTRLPRQNAGSEVHWDVSMNIGFHQQMQDATEMVCLKD